MDRTNVSEGVEREGAGKARSFTLLPFDGAILILGALLSRCAALFGAHPFGLALVCALPRGVWFGLAGAVLGALSLGGDGIIYAAVSVVAAFLRMAITSGKGRNEDGSSALFCEGALLRASTSVIAGFVAAVYHVLLDGFSLMSVFSGATMIVAPPVTVLILYSLFSAEPALWEKLRRGGDPFTLKGLDDRQRVHTVLVQLGAVGLVFLTGLSLAEFSFFGISLAYVFSAGLTLIAARRCGALRGAAAGFASLLGVDASAAVCFALAGITAGLTASLGILYSVTVAGIALSAWSGYSQGLTGLLSTFPEFVVGASAAFPILKKLSASKEDEPRGSERSASDMVGTMALSYRSRFRGSLDLLEDSLAKLSTVVKKYGEGVEDISEDEYKYLVMDCQDRFCKTCAGYRACLSVGRHGCADRAPELAKRLMSKQAITADDINTDSDRCILASGIAAEINRAAAELEAQRYRQKRTDFTAEDYTLVCKMINEARQRDEAERASDSALSDKLKNIFADFGFSEGEIRAFGSRRKHIIAAGEDEDGRLISSPQLREKIEAAAGIRLGAPEYFRRGRVALMECTAGRMLRAGCAVAQLPGAEGEISGDTALHFESALDVSYTLISDGMGSGRVAKETSDFSAKFLERLLDFGCSEETALHALNRVLRDRDEECSATVDLFALDLLNMEAVFTKCGAAPSYVKRGSSIFRIRSRTAPLGLMKTIDAERIRVEIKPGDYVIMLSDGISQSPEDAPWLLELLASSAPDTLSEYASLILSAAVNNVKVGDDMTVAVTRVERI